MKRHAFAALACSFALFALFVPAARADTLLTLNISGKFGVPPQFNGATNGSFSGTMVMDATTGTAVSGDLTAVLNGLTYTFDGPANNTQYFSQLEATSINFAGSLGSSLNILFHGDLSGGYNGQALCSVDDPCGPFRNYATDLYTPADGFSFAQFASASATPEPSSLVLLGTGLLAGAGLPLRSRRPSFRIMRLSRSRR